LADGEMLAQVRFRARGQDMTPAPITVPVSVRWREQVKRIGFGLPDSAGEGAQVERAASLWEAIFPVSTPVTAKDAGAAQAASAKTIHRGWYHRDLAGQLSVGLGGVFSYSFAQQAVMTAGARGWFSQKSLAILDTTGPARFPPGVSHLAGIYDTRRFGTPLSRSPNKARSPKTAAAAGPIC